jgi:hypothetical protein
MALALFAFVVLGTGPLMVIPQDSVDLDTPISAVLHSWEMESCELFAQAALKL